MRRWIRRILFALLILIIVSAAAIQIILWTDYPRRMVISLLQQQLGLRIRAEAMSTGWLGSTELRKVQVSLPLSQESFLDVPTMRISHTAVIPLLLFQNFRLSSVEMDKPALLVKREAGGKWNLAEASDLIDRAGGPSDPTARKKLLVLPRIKVIDATVAVIEQPDRKTVIEPLTITGTPDGLLVFHLDLEVPDRLKIVGEVAPGENWKHELTIFADPGNWLSPWLDKVPTPLVVNGKWGGIISNNGLTGRLLLDETKYDVMGARGRVLVQTDGRTFTVTPQGLVITTPDKLVPEIALASGTVQVDGSKFVAHQVRVSAAGGAAQVDGSGDVFAKTADFNAIWQELAGPWDIVHSGNFSVTVRTPFAGNPKIDGTIVTRGRMPRGQWDGEIRVTGGGPDLTHLDWLARVNRLNWSAHVPFTIDGLSARIATRGDKVTLSDLTWPAAEQLVGRGQYDAGEDKWNLFVNGRGAVNAPFDLTIDAVGDSARIQLNKLLLRTRGIDFQADGAYVIGDAEPLDLKVYLTHTPQDFLTEVPPPVAGKLFAEGNIRGTLDPVHLINRGTLRTKNLVAFGHDYGDMRGIIEGTITPQRADFTVKELALFGGLSNVQATYPYSGDDRMIEGNPIRVSVHGDQLKLHEIGELVNLASLSGVASGDLTIDIPVPRPRRDLIAMKGTFRSQKPAYDTISADEIEADVALRNGVLRADPIKLRKSIDVAINTVPGTATASFEVALNEPKKPGVHVSTQAWPIKLGDNGMAAVTAETDLAIDLTQSSVSGPLRAKIKFATTQQTLGEASIEGRADGQLIFLDSIRASACGGQATGSAILNASDPEHSTATLNWSGIQADQLAELIPKLNGLSGAYAGTIELAPATSERAIEPLRLTLNITPENGKFRAIQIKAAKLSAFLSISKDLYLNRIVLDQLPEEERAAVKREKELDIQGVAQQDRPLGWNDIRIADGRITFWFRRAEHLGQEVQSHVIAQFQHLDLNQITQTAYAEAKPLPGRLTGRLLLHGTLYDLNLVIGDGHVDVSDSDLANTAALSTLYDLVQLGTAPARPIGRGSFDLTLQQSTLMIRNLRYFNRGIEAYSSSISMGNIWKVPDSPLSGFVVGSAQPLRDLKLPWLGDIDQILSVLQAGLTTIRLGGTVQNPTATVVPFREAGDALRRFIVGDVNAETDGQR